MFIDTEYSAISNDTCTGTRVAPGESCSFLWTYSAHCFNDSYVPVGKPRKSLRHGGCVYNLRGCASLLRLTQHSYSYKREKEGPLRPPCLTFISSRPHTRAETSRPAHWCRRARQPRRAGSRGRTRRRRAVLQRAVSILRVGGYSASEGGGGVAPHHSRVVRRCLG